MRRRRHRRKPIQKKPEGNEQFLKPTVQTKLSMGKPGDKYEVEADKMADQVVSNKGKDGAVQKKEGEEEVQQKPLGASVTPLVQKMGTSEEEGAQAKLQRKEDEEPVQKQEEEEAVQSKEEEEVQAKEEEEAVQSKEEEEVQAKEEEEAVQAKEEEEAQAKEEEEAVQSKEEEEVQAKEEEETVQSKEEEEVQAKEEEETVQSKEEEEVQAKEEEEAVQSKEEEEVQAKSNDPKKQGNSIENRLRNGQGGQKMDSDTRSEMEQGFGADFNNVNIHTDTEAQNMSQDIGAQAFTHGNDIYFNQGKYNPNSDAGKHLLAHELTHTIQQKGMVQKKVQRKDVKTGRFKRDKRVSQALNNKKYIRLNDKGEHVSTLQKALIDAGYNLPKNGISGVFNSETDSAVRRYQKDNKLKVDGIVGPQTMGHLDKNFSGPATTSRYTKWYNQHIAVYKTEANFPFHVGLMNFFYKSRNFHVIQMINDKGYTIQSFTGAKDHWKNTKTGAITVTDLSKRLLGNTKKSTNTIRLNANIPINKIALTLYHELHHAYSKEPNYLKQEIEVRIKTEQFAIDNNLPETRKNYRTKTGEVDKAFIEKQINNSSHYNPKGKKRIKREYFGEKVIGPWVVPY